MFTLKNLFPPNGLRAIPTTHVCFVRLVVKLFPHAIFPAFAEVRTQLSETNSTGLARGPKFHIWLPCADLALRKVGGVVTFIF